MSAKIMCVCTKQDAFSTCCLILRPMQALLHFVGEGNRKTGSAGLDGKKTKQERLAYLAFKMYAMRLQVERDNVARG